MLLRNLLIPSLIACVVTTDVIEEVRNEEHKRHSSLLSKVGSIASLLHIHSNQSKLTEAEEKDMDITFADVFTLGDPIRRMADNETKLEDTLCKVHRERGEKILGYVRKKFIIHIITQIGVRLVIKGFNFKNDKYCSDQNTRKEYIKQAINLNAAEIKLQTARNRYTDRCLVIANTTLTSRHNVLPYFCCSWWAYNRESVEAVTQADTKLFVDDMLISYFGFGLKYMCFNHKSGSKRCEEIEKVIPTLPPNYKRPQGFFLLGIQCVSRVTSIV